MKVSKVQNPDKVWFNDLEHGEWAEILGWVDDDTEHVGCIGMKTYENSFNFYDEYGELDSIEPEYLDSVILKRLKSVSIEM